MSKNILEGSFEPSGSLSITNKGFENQALNFGREAVQFLTSKSPMESIVSKPIEGTIVPRVDIVETPTFDIEKSPGELAEAGKFIDKTRRSERFLEQSSRDYQGDPKISVGMENRNSTSPEVANFVVKNNGDIELHGDPEKLNSKKISIMLEREDGQLNPTEAQKKASEQLVEYLSDRLKARFPDKTNNITIDDRDDVISGDIEKKENLKTSDPFTEFDPRVKEAIQRVNRLNTSRGVDMPAHSTDSLVSDTRSVPRQEGETDSEAALKETIAGLFKPDEKAPYETVRKHDGEYRVGRYGLSSEQLMSFIADLGDPPDPALIDKLVKEGKLSKDFAKKLKNPEFFAKFKEFAAKLGDDSQPITSADLKEFLPKEIQESIASKLTDDFKAKLGDQPGMISAAMLSGKSPESITAQDLSSDEAQKVVKAGDQLYSVAEKRQQTEASSQKFEGQVPEGSRRQLIEQALKIAGVPATDANLAAINTIVQKESGWNPNAVNDWDINAKNGTPSKGLMQTIGPTFAQYRDKSLPNDMTDPLANLVAGINYATSRYGSLQNVPGIKGMAKGTGYVGY